MLEMHSSGLANLLKAERTVKLEDSGIVLTARKLTMGDFAQIEETVLSLRADLKKVVADLTEVLADAKDEKIKSALLLGAQQAIEDVIRSLRLVTLAEAVQYEQSREGSAMFLYLACKDKTPELASLEDAKLLVYMSKNMDRVQLEELVDWATSLESLKNSERPEA